MQFVSTHLNKEHFFKKPHAWVLAVLISPIHAAELHYKRRYHLRFEHARKLFILDMSMLLSIFLLSFASLFWYTYDPTITDLVSVAISSEDGRVVSGEEAAYTIDITNYADVTLTSATLTLQTPPGFLIEERLPLESYTAQTDTFVIPDLAPGASFHISFRGTFFAVPHESTPLEARLSYIQEGTTTREHTARTSFASLRGSLLQLSGIFPERIPADAQFPITLHVRNDGITPLENIRIPINSSGLSLIVEPQERITSDESFITIPVLLASTTIDIEAIASVSLQTQTHTISLVPELSVNNTYIPQEGFTHTFTRVSPALFATASWHDTDGPITPGNTYSAGIQITNSGDTPLINVIVTPKTNPAIAQTPHSFTQDGFPALARIEPGASVTLPLSFPLHPSPAGKDLLFAPEILVSAEMESLPTVHTSFTTPLSARPVGSKLRMNADVRYFTAEGDQLGRGPLPPRVGEQTKYWAIFTIANTTSRVRDIEFTASLAQVAQWTGRTAVSLGNDLVYSAANRSVSWEYGSLEPGQQVQLGMEIGMTPTADTLGTSPILMTGISVSGVDTFINQALSAQYGTIDSLLRNDAMAQDIGVSVVK